MAVAMLLAGCALTSLEKDPTSKWGPDKLYNEARGELNNGAWDKARGLFEKLEIRYPFGAYAQQAQIEIAYCYFKSGDPTDALMATDRFLRLYPDSSKTAYVYYLRGLINFIRPPWLVGRALHYQISERDPEAIRQSFEAFKEVVTRYPDSRYYKDSLQRMIFLRNALADHEVHVADYYYRRGAYLSAVARAEMAIRTYDGAPSLDRALGIVVRSYKRLGMTKLQKDAERVLRASYPHSPELKDL